MGTDRGSEDELGTAPIGAAQRGPPLPVYQLPARLGRYLLLERIGVGGMAEVFVAQQDGPAGFQKRVVVKRILPHLAEDPHFVEMFQREARLAASLAHSNVVQVFELGNEGNAHFIAMEHVEGLTVHKLARRAWRWQKSVPLEVVCGIVADAALGLHHAHQLSMVHRDVSPENLMVSVEGITKVLDFGIARSTANAASLTKTGELKGKLPYLAPEAIRGDPLDGRADLYALGVTMYWLLTGQRPITAKSEVMLLHAALTQVPKPPSTINPSVPPGVDQLVAALLEKDPAKRPPSAQAVYDALAEDLPPRSVLSAPFVRDIAALPDAEPGFELTTGDGFIPSSPQTARIISGWGGTPSKSAGRLAGRARGPLVVAAGALLALMLGGAATAWIAAARQTPGDQQGALATHVAPGGDAPTAPAPPTPPVPTPAPLLPLSSAAPVDQPPAVEPAVPAKAAAPVRVRKVELRGPPTVRWTTVRGKALGSGAVSAELPADVKGVVATDTKRGVRAILSVGAGVVDYNAAPKGKLDLRAFPWAEVFLGKESLGVTPLQPLSVVAGTYQVRFVYKDKSQQRTVELGANKTERVIVDFR
ncbi:MAG: serine/threonine protein kinase [Deltaproteobacteria bacterium]|nr:serine/threonine protein kinase [Deltaproteobacteria bacterium]